MANNITRLILSAAIVKLSSVDLSYIMLRQVMGFMNKKFENAKLNNSAARLDCFGKGKIHQRYQTTFRTESNLYFNLFMSMSLKCFCQI